MLGKTVLARTAHVAGVAVAAAALALGAPSASASSGSTAAWPEASARSFTEALCEMWIGGIAPEAVCGDGG